MFECLDLLVTHYPLPLPITHYRTNSHNTVRYTNTARTRNRSATATVNTSKRSATNNCSARTISPGARNTRSSTRPVQSTFISLIRRLQAPDKEGAVRFTVDISVGRAKICVTGNKN